jgi:hypothetical protein
MTIVEEAKNLLDAANIAGIDAIYTYNIPKSNATDTSKTELLIQDNGAITEAYGNDDFHALTGEIEVQLWYSDTTPPDYDAVELAILKAFTAHNWQVSGWRRRIADPDTKQLSNTTYITRTNNV